MGDPRSQELLFKQYYPFAMQIAMRYSKNENNAADILSETFLNVFRSIHTYQSIKGSFHAWLKKIVINECIDQLKKNKHFFASLDTEMSQEPFVDTHLIASLNAMEILELIRLLPFYRESFDDFSLA